MRTIETAMWLAFYAVLAYGTWAFVQVGLRAARARRVWSGPGIELHELISPTGELQDPQYVDRRRDRDAGADDAHDTAVAVFGLGVAPFVNRVPLSVPRTERSLRHG